MKYKLGSIIIDVLRYRFIEKCFQEYKFNGKLLDLGCGKKPYQKLYDNYSVSSVGIDIEQTPHKNELIDKYFNGKDIPYDNETFEFVLCTEVLEHVEKPNEFLKEINRILKSDGYLLITVPFLQLLHEIPFDFFRYTPFGLKSLLEQNNFKTIKIVGFSGPNDFIITTLIRWPLKFFNKLSKILKVKLIFSLYNPFIFVFIFLPQMFYLLINNVVYDDNVYTNKTCKSYGILSKKI